MLDMLIQGGRVVTPAGVGNWDVGIMDEQIVAVAFPGILPGTASLMIAVMKGCSAGRHPPVRKAGGTREFSRHHR